MEVKIESGKDAGRKNHYMRPYARLQFIYWGRTSYMDMKLDIDQNPRYARGSDLLT